MEEKHMINRVVTFTVAAYLIGIALTYFLDGKFDINVEKFLPSVLQAIATIAGIVFAISIITIQHTANTYSPLVLVFFEKNRLFWFMLYHNIGTIIIIGIFILFKIYFIGIILTLLSWNMILLIICLKHIFIFMNNKSIIKKIECQIIEIMNEIKTKVNEHGIRNSTISSLPLYPHLFEKLVDPIAALSSIIYTSYKKHDYESIRIGLSSYSNIIEKRYELEPNVILMTDPLISNIINQINGFTNYALKQDDVIFFRHVVDICHNIMESMLKSKPNPIFVTGPMSPMINMLSELCLTCIKFDKFHEARMIIKYFEIIGTRSITVSNVDNYISQQLYTIFDSVSNKKNTQASFECIFAQIKIFKLKILKTNRISDGDIDNILKYFIKFINIIKKQNDLHYIKLLCYDRDSLFYISDMLVLYTNEINQDDMKEHPIIIKNISYMVDFFGKILPILHDIDIDIHDLTIDCLKEVKQECSQMHDKSKFNEINNEILKKIEMYLNDHKQNSSI